MDIFASHHSLVELKWAIQSQIDTRNSGFPSLLSGIEIEDYNSVNNWQADFPSLLSGIEILHLLKKAIF